jgi:hypothetical protein
MNQVTHRQNGGSRLSAGYWQFGVLHQRGIGDASRISASKSG